MNTWARRSRRYSRYTQCVRSGLLVENLTLRSLVQDQIAFLVKREKYTLSDFQEGLKAGIDKAVSNKWHKQVNSKIFGTYSPALKHVRD